MCYRRLNVPNRIVVAFVAELKLSIGIGQLTTEWQQVGAAVNTTTSPKVQYALTQPCPEDR